MGKRKAKKKSKGRFRLPPPASPGVFGKEGRVPAPLPPSGPPPSPSSLPPEGSWVSVPQIPEERELSLSEGSRDFDPSRGKRKSFEYYGPSDQRDLAALLSYGPPHIPYTYGWTDNRVEQVRHFKHWNFIAIDCRASRIASQLPNVSWVKREDPRKPRDPRQKGLDEITRRRALTPLLTHERMEPVPWNHPLVSLLTNPNNVDTYYDLIYETELFLGLTGSCYWWIPRNAFGLPAAIWVIPSHWMWPIIGKERLIEAWEIRPVEGNYLRRRIPVEEVIHFRKKNPISKIDGFAPLTAGSQWSDVQESVNKAAFHSYRNGPMPTVAITFDGKLSDPTDIQLRQIEAKFLARQAGPERAGKPIWTPPGVSVKPLSLRPDQMVFGNTGKETAHNILATYGIPPGYVFLEGRTDLDEAAFLSRAINPECNFLGSTISQTLAALYPQQEGQLRVWWEAFRTDNPVQINEDIKTDLLAGSITPSEVRIIRGREPWGGKWEEFGNNPLLPVNMEPGTLPGGGTHDPGDNNEKPKPGQPALNSDDTKASPSYARDEDGTWRSLEG